MTPRFDTERGAMVDDDSGWMLKGIRTTPDATTHMQMSHASGAQVDFWARWYDSATCGERSVEAGRLITAIVYREPNEKLDARVMFRLPENEPCRARILALIQELTAAYLRHRLRDAAARVEVLIATPTP